MDLHKNDSTREENTFVNRFLSIEELGSSDNSENETVQSGEQMVIETLDMNQNSISAQMDNDKGLKNKPSYHENIHQTSIEIEDFTPQHNVLQQNSLTVIDENDENSNEGIQSSHEDMIRKDDQPNQRYERSTVYADPLENEQEPIGSGTIVSQIGTGGMSRVYKIWNEKLELFRAAKVLLPGSKNEYSARFLTEAKITAKLNHDNIIEVYNTGEWHGLPFIEMELIEGDTLSTLIHHYGQLPLSVCSAAAIQIAQALAFAHSQKILIYGKMYNGIIHRDLKPSNIMLSTSGTVKLLDFGTARPIEASLHTVEKDIIIGTMHYFSPEQINGDPADILSDIYSFGAILFEMLSGKNPFPQKNMAKLLQAKVKNEIQGLENININMYSQLAEIAKKCLKTDKNERYKSFSFIHHILNQIHYHYTVDSPEKVIAQFYQNPELMYCHFEPISPEVEIIHESSSEGIVQNETPDSFKPKTEILSRTMITETVSKKCKNNDLWEEELLNGKRWYHKCSTIAIIVLMLSLAVIGNVIVKLYSEDTYTSKRFEQLLGHMEKTTYTQNSTIE